MHDQIYAIRVKGRVGFINSAGKIVVPARFDGANYPTERRVAVRLAGKYGIINYRGDYVCEPTFDMAWTFQGGFCKIKLAGRIGYINKEGHVIFYHSYKDSHHFSGGLAAAYHNLLDYDYLNCRGEVILKGNAKTADCCEDLICWCDEVRQPCGYRDKHGEWAISPRYDLACEFSEGMAAVYRKEKREYRCGFINKAGDLVIPYQFGAEDTRFSEGLAAVWNVAKGTRHAGYVNLKGELVISFQFEGAEPFTGGLALVQVKGKKQFINIKGDRAFRREFADAESFRGDLARVSHKNRTAFINRSGDVVAIED